MGIECPAFTLFPIKLGRTFRTYCRWIHPLSSRDMNAKYRPPAIASDQYAFLKIGAMAIRSQVGDDNNPGRPRVFLERAKSFQAGSTVIPSYEEGDCTQVEKAQSSEFNLADLFRITALDLLHVFFRVTYANCVKNVPRPAGTPLLPSNLSYSALPFFRGSISLRVTYL